MTTAGTRSYRESLLPSNTLNTPLGTTFKPSSTPDLASWNKTVASDAVHTPAAAPRAAPQAVPAPVSAPVSVPVSAPVPRPPATGHGNDVPFKGSKWDPGPLPKPTKAMIERARRLNEAMAIIASMPKEESSGEEESSES